MTRLYETPELFAIGPVSNVVLGDKPGAPEEPDQQPQPDMTALDVD